jgi:hypothetical protein
MAIITMPDTLRVGAGSKIEQATFEVVSASDVTGSTQARAYGAPHWSLSLVSPAHLQDADAGAWKSMLLALLGSVNYLSAFDPSRPVPLGTYRGSPNLTATANAGDTTITFGDATQADKTLTVGDWLQIGTGLGTSQLVIVVAPATANGSGIATVQIQAPLRIPYAISTPVFWSRPRGHFRRTPGSGRTAWTPFAPGVTQGFAIDLIEAW